MRGLIVLLLAAVASARLAPLYTHSDRIPGRYIIKLKPGRDVGESIKSLGTTRVFYTYNKLFPGFAAELSDRMVALLRASDAVEYVEEDGIAYASSVASWGLDRVDQLSLPLDNVYDPIGDGSGVDVYVIDTGINIDHDDYTGRAAYGYDALGGSGADCNGHGTHCAGTVAGTQYGVAKSANIVGVRVLGCTGSGSWAGIISGCEWVAKNANGPSVASMSLGGGVAQTVDDAVQSMIDAGITVAVAASNDDDDACQYSPARSANAITVGATDSSDTRAYFSNYGTCVNIFAPGVSITSSWIDGNDATRTISGTSMACPHVAGAAAVMLGNNPTLTPNQVKSALIEKSIAGVVSDAEVGSPNLLLYIGEGSGGGGDAPIPTNPPFPYDPTCGGFFNATSGAFSSPNYPSNYDNNKACSYRFRAPDEVVTVNFDTFDLETSSICGFDSVSIYDGASMSAPLVGKWCGTANPGPVSSTGKDMLLVFESDYSVTFQGFSGTYSMGAAPTYGVCGQTFTEKSGRVTSPKYPGEYDNSINCPFTIEGEKGEKVTLTFTDFDVETHSTCTYDAVEVYDTDASGTLLATLCGNFLPNPITSTGSGLYLLFRTDSSLTYGGFSASYTIN